MKTLIAAALAAATLATAAPVHAEGYPELFAAVDWMAKKYHMGVVVVDAEPLPDRVYGETVGRSITFNTLYVNDPALLRQSLTNDVAMGFHPGKQCTPEQIVAAHESAHVLDYITGGVAEARLVAALKNGLTGQVSGYSLTNNGDVNIPEALADSMVAVECDTPTPAEAAIYNMLVH